MGSTTLHKISINMNLIHSLNTILAREDRNYQFKHNLEHILGGFFTPNIIFSISKLTPSRFKFRTSYGIRSHHSIYINIPEEI